MAPAAWTTIRVFVLTHHERASFTPSDTTFHFVDATLPTELVDRFFIESVRSPSGATRLLFWRRQLLGAPTMRPPAAAVL